MHTANETGYADGQQRSRLLTVQQLLTSMASFEVCLADRSLKWCLLYADVCAMELDAHPQTASSMGPAMRPPRRSRCCLSSPTHPDLPSRRSASTPLLLPGF